MQISDLVNQYSSNLASGSEISTGTKGVEQLVSTVRQMNTGHMFEGTVNSIKGNQVILGLSSGQNITARLDKGITLEKGQSMFFQVKANDGNQIQIRPVSFGSVNNPTLLNALDAAKLPMTESHLNMVNTMMKEQMPIDVKSLADMSRIAASNPEADISTIVEMTKLDIPITPEFIQQFENYKVNQGQIVNDMNQILNQIPEALVSEEIDVLQTLNLNKGIVQLFTESNITEQANISGENTVTLTEQGVITNNVNDLLQNIQNPNATAEEVASNVINDNPGDVTESAQLVNSRPLELLTQEEYPANTVGNTVNEENLISFNGEVKNLLSNHPEVNTTLLDENGNLDVNMTSKEFMTKLSEAMNQMQGLTKDDTGLIFNHKAYKNLLGNLMEQQMTFEIKEDFSKEKVEQLYKNIREQMQALDNITSKAGKAGENLSKVATNLSNNVEFMNFVNQTYSYVQIPLHLAKQNASSELYVYANNKGGKSDNEEVTAFLHFDMEHLGSTDISVKMIKKNVDTKFYMENDAAYDLIANNIHILQAKLEAKGYTCKITVDNEGNSVNFVEDFLKQDVKTGGTLHRYSFDVRA